MQKTLEYQTCFDFDSLQNESDKFVDFATIVDCVSAPVSVGSD